jgi:CubicO group peptidase (beta-lactamase class C family)
MQRTKGTRRARRVLGGAVALAVLALGLEANDAASATSNRAEAKAIVAAVEQAMQTTPIRSVIVKVTRGDRVVLKRAFGTSIEGVPATADMHFRNGAVAFSYLGTLLMRFVDEGRVSLDDTIDRWIPTLPEAGTVTLRMLANQTSGYPDYETDPAWLAAFNADPWHLFTYEERLKFAFENNIWFTPGTNWGYAHTNFMILGEVLALIGNKPLDVLLREKVLKPMGLRDTEATTTPEIPEPVLHSYSGERRPAFGIPAQTPFYEEATYWNTQWGTPIGANQTTTIDDMATTAVKVGTGALLSESSYDAMTGPHLLGFGHSDPACGNSCFTQVNGYNYGLGVVRSGSWILQNPALSGYGSTEAYLPSDRIAIAVVVTYLPGAFDAKGNYDNLSDPLFRDIGAIVAPDDPPPTHRG